MALTQAPEGSLAGYVLELSESEVEALKAVVREADARKSETQTAQRAMGMR